VSGALLLVAAALQATAETKSAAEGRLPLFGEYTLADPWFLLLVPLALLACWRGRPRRRGASGRVPVLPGRRLPHSLAQRLEWVPPVLQALGLCLAAVALARPLRGNVQTDAVSEGVDIALVIDRSSSMGHKDLEGDRTRLDVVKEVVAEFAHRRMTDRDGNADNIGLFTFAKYPEELCPFTLDADAILGFIQDIRLVSYAPEDGTGIGIALAKAVQVLRATDARSKVIVLLTDGENNLDLIAPLEAALLAAEEGIRVYTIFAGRYVSDRFGRLFEVEQEIDTRELEKIAGLTGARFFRARDRKALEAAYDEIERLERTERREKRLVEHYDLYPRLLAAGLGLYVASWLCFATWARRLP
jgi:Ca-activated chloride channel family protein